MIKALVILFDFIHFSPSVQLDFYYSCHGDCAYKISWTFLRWFKSYKNI